MTIDDVYQKVPALKCKGLCTRACGVILLQDAEYERVVAARPIPTRFTGINGATKPTDAQLTCPMLAKGRCTIYDVRPLICRIWGTVKAAKSLAHCPHGCKPNRWLNDAEAHALIDEIRAISPGQRALHADIDSAVRSAHGGER